MLQYYTMSKYYSDLQLTYLTRNEFYFHLYIWYNWKAVSYRQYCSIGLHVASLITEDENPLQLTMALNGITGDTLL